MKSTYFIPAMDCPAEVALIRSRLKSVREVDGLEFDLFNRRLTVRHAGVDEADIVAALRGIGMAPFPSDGEAESAGKQRLEPAGSDRCEGAARAADASDAPMRSRWLAVIPLVISGVLAGLAEALSFAGVRESSWPVIVIALASIASGGIPTLRKGLLAVRTFTLNINFLMTVAVGGRVRDRRMA
jgi:Cd2+/Zn2+-exporting ATPase